MKWLADGSFLHPSMLLCLYSTTMVLKLLSIFLSKTIGSSSLFLVEELFDRGRNSDNLRLLQCTTQLTGQLNSYRFWVVSWTQRASIDQSSRIED